MDSTCACRLSFVDTTLTDHTYALVPTLTGTISYIKNFIQDQDVAAVMPSSSFLVRRVCKWIDFDEPATIVEYGPGNGVFSEYIVEHMTADSTLVLVETNSEFIEMLEEKYADDDRVIVVEDRAENVEQILADHDLGEVNYIVSGIPFSFLDEETRAELLQKTHDVLTEDGKFLVYQYYNHLEEPLREQFAEVTKEREYLNVPPTIRAYEACK